MPTKLKIRMGHIEFEYEGDTQFNTGEIKDLFSHLESLVGVTPPAAFETPPHGGEEAAATAKPVASTPLNFSPNTIAARLGANSGPDLLIASAAYIQIVQGEESFKRKELLDTMQSAKTYYKQSMSGNLSKMLSTLVGASRLNELASGEYSLPASEQESLRARLAAK